MKVKNYSFREILGKTISPNIVKEIIINPKLKTVRDTLICLEKPMIPDTRDNIITVNEVKVLILIPGAIITCPPPQQPQPPQQSILIHQSIIKYIINLIVTIVT